MTAPHRTAPGAATQGAAALVDADAVVAAATTCPGVARMSGGPLGTVATYLPGRRVPGVRVDDGTLEVHVVAEYGTSIPRTSDQIRAAVAGLAGGRAVRVVVEDLETPGGAHPSRPDVGAGR